MRRLGGTIVIAVCASIAGCGARATPRVARSESASSDERARVRIGSAFMFGVAIDPSIVVKLRSVWRDPEDALRSAIRERLRSQDSFGEVIELVKTSAGAMRRAAMKATVDTTDVEATALELRAARSEGDEIEIIERRFDFDRAIDEASVALENAMAEAALGTARAFLALSSASHEYVMSEITQASAEEIAKPAGVVPSVLVPIAQAAARRIHGELFDEATRDVVATIVEDLVRERRAEWVKLSRPK